MARHCHLGHLLGCWQGVDSLPTLRVESRLSEEQQHCPDSGHSTRGSYTLN